MFWEGRGGGGIGTACGRDSRPTAGIPTTSGFVLMEEGLVEPINTNSSEKRYAMVTGYKGEGEGGGKLTSRYRAR